MKKFGVFILAILMVSGFGTVASAAPTFSFDIEFNGVNSTGTRFDLLPGGTVKVDILFSITETGLLGAGFDLSFDSSLLAASSLAPGLGWTPLPGNGIAPGHVFFEAAAFSPLGPGDLLLATFDLTCTDPGFTELVMNDFNDQPNWLLADGVTVIDGDLGFPFTIASVNQVPIPGAVWLLGSALFGLVGLRRRIKG